MRHFEEGFMGKFADAINVVKQVAQKIPSMRDMQKEVMRRSRALDRSALLKQTASAAGTKPMYSAAAQKTMSQMTPASQWRKALAGK